MDHNQEAINNIQVSSGYMRADEDKLTFRLVSAITHALLDIALAIREGNLSAALVRSTAVNDLEGVTEEQHVDLADWLESQITQGAHDIMKITRPSAISRVNHEAREKAFSEVLEYLEAAQ